MFGLVFFIGMEPPSYMKRVGSLIFKFFEKKFKFCPPLLATVQNYPKVGVPLEVKNKNETCSELTMKVY